MKKFTLALAAVAAMGGLVAGTAPASAWYRHGYYHGYYGGPVSAGLLGFGVGLAAASAVAAPVVYAPPVYVAPSYPVVTTRVVYRAPRAQIVYRAPYRVRRVVYR